MSKQDKLVFSVKKSLVVGTTTVTLAASGCTVNPKTEVTSNPVPPDTQRADAASDTATEADAGDAGESNDASDTDDGSDPDSSSAGDTG